MSLCSQGRVLLRGTPDPAVYTLKCKLTKKDVELNGTGLNSN